MTPADRLRALADVLDAHGITDATCVHATVHRVPLAQVEAVAHAFRVERIAAGSFTRHDYLRATHGPWSQQVTVFSDVAPEVPAGNPYSDLSVLARTEPGTGRVASRFEP